MPRISKAKLKKQHKMRGFLAIGLAILVAAVGTAFITRSVAFNQNLLPTDEPAYNSVHRETPEFSWSRLPDTDMYLFRLGKKVSDNEPAQIIYSRVVSDTSHIPDIDLEDGIYVWSVRSGLYKTGKQVFSINVSIDGGFKNPTPVPDLPKPDPRPDAKDAFSIGFIGCSNSWQTVDGYHSTPGNQSLFWEGITEYSGATIEKWENNDAKGWDTFERKIKDHGQPDIVWFQMCERDSEETTFDSVVNVINNIKSRTNADIYVSPLNSFNPPGLCKVLGSDNIQDLIAFANQASSEGYAYRGPDLGPLSESQTEDGCHPSFSGSQNGRLILGEQLADFFE